MRYVAEVKYIDRETADKVKYFTMDFTGVEPPEGFDAPKITDPPMASAKDLGVKAKSPVFDVDLKGVQGHWMADSDGNLRYCTTGDFGDFDIIPMEWLSHLVLMDTIWNVYQRLGPKDLS